MDWFPPVNGVDVSSSVSVWTEFVEGLRKKGWQDFVRKIIEIWSLYQPSDTPVSRFELIFAHAFYVDRIDACKIRVTKFRKFSVIESGHSDYPRQIACSPFLSCFCWDCKRSSNSGMWAKRSSSAPSHPRSGPIPLPGFSNLSIGMAFQRINYLDI